MTIKNNLLNIKVELDEKQIFKNDPGQGTPALVIFNNEYGHGCGTWNCVTSEGEDVDGTQLNEEQKEWLDQVTPKVNAWMERHGV